MWTIDHGILEGKRDGGGSINSALFNYWPLDNSLGETISHNDFRPSSGGSAAQFINDNPIGSGYSYLAHNSGSYDGFETISGLNTDYFSYSFAFWSKGTGNLIEGSTPLNNIGLVPYGLSGFRYDYISDTSIYQIQFQPTVNFTITGYDPLIWNHIVFTVDYLTNNVKIYLNNSLIINTSGVWNQFHNYTLKLGFCDASTQISNIGFYKKILTQEEITAIYNSQGIPSHYSPDPSLSGYLKNYWTLEHTLYDFKAGNHLSPQFSEPQANYKNNGPGDNVFSYIDASYNEVSPYFYQVFKSSQTLDFSGDYSVAHWFKKETMMTGLGNEGWIQFNDTDYYTYGFGTAPAPTLGFYMGIGTGTYNIYQNDASLNKWHHACATYDYDTSICTFYIDGSLKKSFDLTGTSSKIPPTDLLEIRGRNSDLQFANIAFYNKALTPEEAMALYNWEK
jgi:hypothetical protein